MTQFNLINRNDIGFVKEDNSQGNNNVWDEEW